ncbi:synaptogenesis protein syg-2-like [Oppia nitens]|uniref:synaptogenesis protein syg-2-like n=1 Tax=Oppia nitens TaxID=1686743 RepID=UPI0023D9D728|nr:synaptogenesis protein syg-2-like [Oppia nitens]
MSDYVLLMRIALVFIISLTISVTQQTIHTTNTNITSHQYFKVKPRDIEVIEGSDVELECQIGAPTGVTAIEVRVQWAKDGFLLGYNRIIPGFDRYLMVVDDDKLIYNLIIHKTQIDDEAEFECQSQVQYLFGNKQSIRSSAHLKLIVPPKFVKINGSKAIDAYNPFQSSGSNIFIAEAKEGEKIVLICSASPSKPPPKLKWYRKNIELLTEAAKTAINKTLVNNRHILYLVESYLVLYPKHEEEYRCVAEHPGLIKTLRATVLINIFRAPKIPVIDGYKDGDIVNFGEKLTLKCSSSNGYPPPSLIWLRNGIEIDRSHTVSSRNEVINTLSLVVSATDNMAQYTCQASNPMTAIPLTQTVTLSVLFLPTKITITGPNEVPLIDNKGTTIKLKCTAYPASPPPLSTKLKWFVDDTEVTSGDEHMDIIRKDKNTWTVTSNLTYTLSHQDLNIKIFKCTGYTLAMKEESISAIHKVNVIHAPDFPTLLGIKDSVVTAIVGTIVKCKCVSYSGNPRPQLVWFNHHNREISAISSQTGSGVSSELVIRAEIEDNGHTFKCRVYHPALDKPYEITFQLIVQLMAMNTTTIANTMVTDTTTTVTTTTDHNNANNTDFPEPPTQLLATNTSHNSVVISWNPGFDFGYEQSFRIRYRKVDSKLSQYKYIIVNNTLNTVLIDNLDPNTEYQFGISSRNKLGESLMSREFLTVKTLPNLVPKRKLESVLASADEQRLGYNNQLISEDIVELSIIVSLLVMIVLTTTSIVICCYRRHNRVAAQVPQKTQNRSKDMSSANGESEEPFSISGSTTLDSSCHLETTFNNDKCLYVANGDSLNDFGITKMSQKFLYKTQPDILIINQPFLQSDEQCFEVHPTYVDNDFNLTEININETKIASLDLMGDNEVKVQRVTIVKPIVMNAYSLGTLNEEEEML